MFTRRSFVLSSLAGCAAGSALAQAQVRKVPVDELDPKAPQILQLRGQFTPGAIHVDPGAFALYFILPENKAIRYAVGIGRAGLYERGTFFVGAKKEWPSWTPTKEMIERNPRAYARYADGMPGGPSNPLGARALYLFTKAKGDTFLRIHGTNAPDTIGTAVSNGCVRLENRYIEDLYARVQIGAQVVLH